MHDLEWISQHRLGLKDAAGIDVALVRQVARRLPAKELREAFESVLVGDMVVRHLTKHWQEPDRFCQCGLPEETVDHVLWHCPRYVQQRRGNSRCGEGAWRQFAGLPAVVGRPGPPA